MYSLTFIKDENSKTVTEGRKYEVMTWDTGAKTVIIYDDPHSAQGTEFKVAKSSENLGCPYRFEVCYITNDSGKTIDRIEPE